MFRNVPRGSALAPARRAAPPGPPAFGRAGPLRSGRPGYRPHGPHLFSSGGSRHAEAASAARPWPWKAAWSPTSRCPMVRCGRTTSRGRKIAVPSRLRRPAISLVAP
jgi:hypothetical protein